MRRSLQLALGAVSLVGVGAIAFFVGKSKSEDEIKELSRQVVELQAAEQEAAVVKRVSQQMEDIAYQQKSISDEQRILAERQSELAMANFARAEAESRNAKKASSLAEEQRLRAENERTVAVEAEQEARDQRDKAQLQKQISDILSQRSLSRSLGSASVSQRELGNHQLASTLAFASYYFADKTHGNVYQQETYSAMLQSTHQIASATLAHSSPIGEIVCSNDGCVAVTTYGEVLRFKRVGNDDQLTSEMVFEDKRYDFRGVVPEGRTIWALDRDGILMHIPIGHNYAAPQDAYRRLYELDNDLLLLQGKQSLCWFSRSKMQFVHQEKFSVPLSFAAVHKGQIYLFHTDGSQSIIDASGKLKPVSTLVNEVVTTCVFDTEDRCYMGTDKGAIYCTLGTDRISLIGHSSGIIDIALCQNDLLISSSYDHTVKLWNLPQLASDSEMNKAYIRTAKLQGASSMIENEWVVPASFDYDGWPTSLSISTDRKMVWVGTSGGQITTLSTSMRNMAEILHRNLTNLTPQQWQTYVGQISEYIDFKNVKL